MRGLVKAAVVAVVAAAVVADTRGVAAVVSAHSKRGTHRATETSVSGHVAAELLSGVAEADGHTSNAAADDGKSLNLQDWDSSDRHLVT